ncbi:Sugar (and other) transporter [Rhizoctonia solani]|uniref:Sugar (And other) transporter n=1 Tax=Rhizoctonia solani TaxID=456999 RepID=A0A8H8P089_9AGAM|nr:Sugar (and other) transporter [Rhizoctonia solani]QRW21960.1 Sugar (and other) transporter [Rhizoctonia solani]
MAPAAGGVQAASASIDPSVLFKGLPLATSYANGFDGSMMNGLQSVQQWKDYFGNPSAKDLGLFNAIQSIGALCGTPFAPYITDIFGRRAGILLGAILVLFAAALQTATQNLGMFISARFLIGFGSTFAGMASPLLISEVAYPTHRAVLTSLYNSFWFSGSIVAAWSTFGTFRIPSNWSWRIPSALQGLSSVIQLALIWFLPESPRWLISKGRDDEARQVLVKWHAGGREEDPLVAMEYTQIKEALGLESQNANASWLDLFRTPGNRRRIRIIFGIAVFSQWSGNGLISYYLERVLNGIGITKTDDQTLINGVLSIYNWLAFMNLSVMGAIIFNQYTNPIALDALQWKYYLVYSCWLVFELAYMYMFAVETKGRSLEETAALFDGDEAVYELKDRMKADIVESGHRQEEKGPVNESQVELLSRPSRAA